MRKRSFLALAATISLLTACGGNGGSAGGGIVPKSSPTQSQKGGGATFVVKIPPKRTTALRSRHFITANVQGIDFSVSQNGVSTDYSFFALNSSQPYCSAPPLGGLVCTLQVAAHPGHDTFVVNTYDAPNAFTYAIVSTGTLTADIAAQQANTINIATSGVPTFFALSVDNPFPASAITQQVHVLATDTDSNIIVGPYDAPLSVTDSDTSGATTLSATTLNSSADAAALTLGYNGNALPSGATVQIQATGANSSNNGSMAGNLHFNPQMAGVISAPSFLEFVSPSDAPQTITLSGPGTTAPFTADTNSDYWNDSGILNQQNLYKTGGIAGCAGVVTVSGSSPTFTVTPVAAGICNLNLRDNAGNYGTVAIDVQSSAPVIGATPAPQFNISPAEVSLNGAGSTGTFTASDTSYTGTYTAASSNTNVATVSGTGPAFTVTAVSAGQALVTVSESNGHQATVTVTVSTTTVPIN